MDLMVETVETVEVFFLEASGTLCFPHLLEKLHGRFGFPPCIKGTDNGRLYSVDYVGRLDAIHLPVKLMHSPTYGNRDGINGTDWIQIDRAAYDKCIDGNNYRPQEHVACQCRAPLARKTAVSSGRAAPAFPSRVPNISAWSQATRGLARPARCARQSPPGANASPLCHGSGGDAIPRGLTRLTCIKPRSLATGRRETRQAG